MTCNLIILTLCSLPLSHCFVHRTPVPSPRLLIPPVGPWWAPWHCASWSEPPQFDNRHRVVILLHFLLSITFNNSIHIHLHSHILLYMPCSKSWPENFLRSCSMIFLLCVQYLGYTGFEHRHGSGIRLCHWPRTWGIHLFFNSWFCQITAKRQQQQQQQQEAKRRKKNQEKEKRSR